VKRLLKKKRQNRRSPPARLRIVAGKWRGCFLPVVDEPGLRPTSERIRETLFNWLTAHLEGANCLDLFAGTGALGFEALSRGAAKVCFIEGAPKVAQAIRDAATVLQASDVNLQVADAIAWLQTAKPQPFDIVFLDPPFADDYYAELCRLLSERQWLAKIAYIYIEQDSKEALPVLPDGWNCIKEKKAGNVRYSLIRAMNKGRSR
tara:strand:- start:501 stop:1115 length:615 start_codon:yes stop_codon:yes gene_type:complete